jgi:hypothetical protein
MRLTIALFAPALLVVAAAVPPRDGSPVAEAVALQPAVLSDPRFAGILRELEGLGAIDWSDRFHSPAVEEEAMRFPNKLEWLLGRYAERGGYGLDKVRLWRKVNPWSSTVAVTVPLEDSTKLNRWQLSKVPSSIANTLIHERGHSFGTVHPETQTRRGNECDASYIAGDLAQALLVQGGARAREAFDKPMCPALCASLQRHGVATAAELGKACRA